MSYLSYDLAKAIVDDRVSRAMAESQWRRVKKDRKLTSRKTPVEEADVIEMTFGTHCDTEQIGA